MRNADRAISIRIGPIVALSLAFVFVTATAAGAWGNEGHRRRLPDRS